MSRIVRYLAVCGVVGWTGMACGDETETSRRRVVLMEVVIAETSEKGQLPVGLDAAAADKHIARIRELESLGKLASLTRVRLSTLEDCVAMVQLGEKAPYVAAQAVLESQPRRGGGQGIGTGSLAYNWQESGTVISATPRVEEEGTILVELHVEKLGPAHGTVRDRGEPERPATPSRLHSVRSECTVRVPNGQTIIAQGIGASSETEESQSVILLTARVESATKATTGKSASTRAEHEIKIFALKNATASSAGAILSSIFDGRPVKVAVDERTNSLILQGPRREFEAVEAILLRLDQTPTAPERK